MSQPWAHGATDVGVPRFPYPPHHPRAALTKGVYWRNEASLVATVLVRFWLMLREDLGLLRRFLGRRTQLEVGAVGVEWLGCGTSEGPSCGGGSRRSRRRMRR